MSKESLASEHLHDPTRYEHPQLCERLDWNFENKTLFGWEAHTLGIGRKEVGESTKDPTTTLPGPYDLRQSLTNRFLDSSNPSGWSSPDEIRVKKV